jgi:hypothetical protein
MSRSRIPSLPPAALLLPALCPRLRPPSSPAAWRRSPQQRLGIRAGIRWDEGVRGEPRGRCRVLTSRSTAALRRCFTEPLNGTILEFQTAGDHCSCDPYQRRELRLFSVPLLGGAPVLLRANPENLHVHRSDGSASARRSRRRHLELFSAPADGGSPSVRLSGTMVAGGSARPFSNGRREPDGTRVVYPDQTRPPSTTLQRLMTAVARCSNLSRPLADAVVPDLVRQPGRRVPGTRHGQLQRDLRGPDRRQPAALKRSGRARRASARSVPRTRPDPGARPAHRTARGLQRGGGLPRTPAKLNWLGAGGRCPTPG